MEITSPRKKKLVPSSREEKEIVLVSNPSRKRGILDSTEGTKGARTKGKTRQGGATRPADTRQGPKRKVMFDDDKIQFLETPKKRPVYPNKSKQQQVAGKDEGEPLVSISTTVMPKNEQHGPLELDVIKKVGTGSYGDVFQVKVDDLNKLPSYFPTSNNYALKKMLDPKLNRAFEFEQKIMNEIQKKYPKCSPHVLCYFDISIDKNGIYYLLSEMQEGDVKDIYKSTPDQKERLNISYELLYQSLLGLQELKTSGLHHRDIKMDNILYNTQKKNGNIVYKLADFGLSCSDINPDIKCGTGVYGTPAYISPKVLILNFSGKASTVEDLWDETDDIYSLAAMMYEFVFGEELMKTDAFTLFTEMFGSQKEIQPETKIDKFMEILENQYQQASKVINKALSSVEPNSDAAKVYRFILININPFEKKQTIRQAIKSLS